MILLAELLSTVFERRYRPSVLGRHGNRPLVDLADGLIGSVGDISGRSMVLTSAST